MSIPRARAIHHKATRHHQHFFVRERDPFAGIDRGQHRFERRGTGRGTEHQIDGGMGRNGDKSFAAGPVTLGQRLAEE
jgi:hypothetical protein